MKILSIHDLATIRKRAEHNLSLREESNEKVTEKCYGLASGAQHLQILICGGTGCKASSSQGITDNLLKAIKKSEITDKVEVITVGSVSYTHLSTSLASSGLEFFFSNSATSFQEATDASDFTSNLSLIHISPMLIG